MGVATDAMTEGLGTIGDPGMTGDPGKIADQGRSNHPGKTAALRTKNQTDQPGEARLQRAANVP
jgi:hypothetical protein